MLVMQRWQITKYRMSKLSGVVETTVGKLVNGELQSTSWDNVEKLANGLGKLDPMAKAAFIGVLTVPEKQLPGPPYGITPLPELEEMEKPENIAKVLAAADEYGANNQKVSQEIFEQRATTLERLVSSKLQFMRAQESDQNA